MFQANIVSKEVKPDGVLKIEVEFTDGQKTFTETVIPQDMDGLTYFIKGRLTQLNFGTGNDVAVGPFTPPTPAPIPVDEQARNDWLVKVGRAARLKSLLVDPGVFTDIEVGLDSLQAEIKKDFKPEYLTFI